MAGRGSHLAMAGAHVLASESGRQPGDATAAFAAYERFHKPHVERKQRQAVRMAASFVPSVRSWARLRRLAIRALFSPPLIRWASRAFGARGILRDGR